MRNGWCDGWSPASDGGRLLTCDGVSDLVRGQASLFLTALEDPITVLDPAETQLVADASPMFNAALLAIESQRRRIMPNDARIHLGHRAVMDLEPYQLEPALQALRQPRSRILIADAVHMVLGGNGQARWGVGLQRVSDGGGSCGSPHPA